MNNCLSCGKPVKNKYCNVSCQNKHQNKDKVISRYGNYKEFEVFCTKCGKSIKVIEREKLHPIKEKYYCSRSCANSRVHNGKTKEKIKNGLIKFFEDNNTKITKNCKNCGIEYKIYPSKKDVNKFCSRSCATTYRNKYENLGHFGGLASLKKRISIKKDDSSGQTFIYSLEYPTGEIKYIGKSNNPGKRLKRHLIEAKWRNKNDRDKWLNSLPEKPTLKIIEKVNYSEWQSKEIYWIKFYIDKGFKLVNGTDGGEGSNGFKGKNHTDVTKEKIRKKRKKQR